MLRICVMECCWSDSDPRAWLVENDENARASVEHRETPRATASTTPYQRPTTSLLGESGIKRMCDCGALSWWKDSRSEEEERSTRIDKALRDWKRELAQECKVLLLGTGESGKSTMIKQMCIIRCGGIPEEERQVYCQVIYRNIVESAQAIVEAILNIGLLHPNQAAVDKISACVASEDMPIMMSSELTDAIHQFWTDPMVERVIDEHGSEFYLMDNATYFFSEVHRIASPGYIPTETDVLNARQKTTRITETLFPLRTRTMRVIDVGGQRSERKKWIHCFQDVTSILFFSALSEYDQALREDKTQNGMHESLSVFESICTSPWFCDTSFILFLNKSDIFEKKLSRSPVGRYFPDYEGGEDFEKACMHFKKLFGALSRSPHRTTYMYITTATDTAAFRVVMNAVEGTIVRMNLQMSGMV
ncbi:hypothetical protein D9758_009337 [Tetrapyrgos nigripes]|uniref:Uncharacterized protein n=1 Tax=Tetrapyrgos nigripes TaxID=182062 RepID=A0A8H5GGT3_9AGAR|nr:hypothetical protein D9758_009337 [Tetrapyrgos nigripes]